MKVNLKYRCDLTLTLFYFPRPEVHVHNTTESSQLVATFFLITGGVDAYELTAWNHAYKQDITIV